MSRVYTQRGCKALLVSAAATICSVKLYFGSFRAGRSGNSAAHCAWQFRWVEG